MSAPHDRLRAARIAAGWETAKGFSDAERLPQSTYISHELGTRGLRPKAAERYGRALNVRPAWLLFGDGFEATGHDANVARRRRPVTAKASGNFS